MQNELDLLFSQAKQALLDSQAILQEVLDGTDSSDGSAKNDVQMLQLTLQYRLDTQDAFVKLLQVDQGLLQILGIEPQHSSKINLERMEFALGNNDLHHILYALSQLVHSLMQTAYRYQQHLDKNFKHKQKQTTFHLNPPNTKLAGRLQNAVDLQKRFIKRMTEISCHLALWNKHAAIGPVHDHIAALRGPISQFFQAVQNGLELTNQLYEKTNEDIQLEHNLSKLLEEADSVLKHLPATYQPQHFFSPPKTEHTEHLEKRASNKRLGNYFSYE